MNQISINLDDCGILFVATKDERYLAEAFLSAHSIKDVMPDISITLFTNLKNSNFAKSKCFDKVIPISSVKRYTSEWAEGQLDRIGCLNSSPYKYTLHLDSDTRVCSDEIRSVFLFLQENDIAMVECAEDASVSRFHYGRPMFNVGFILYRESEKVATLFDKWAKLTAKQFEMATKDAEPTIPELAHISDVELRRELLFMDQLSMVQLLSTDVNVFNLKLKILPERWNYRGSAEGRQLEGEMVVNHDPELRNHLGEDVISIAVKYQSKRLYRRALPIYESLLKQVPDDVSVLLHVANCYVGLNDNKKTKKIIKKILQISPNNKKALELQNK